QPLRPGSARLRAAHRAAAADLRGAGPARGPAVAQAGADGHDGGLLRGGRPRAAAAPLGRDGRGARAALGPGPSGPGARHRAAARLDQAARRDPHRRSDDAVQRGPRARRLGRLGARGADDGLRGRRMGGLPAGMGCGGRGAAAALGGGAEPHRARLPASPPRGEIGGSLLRSPTAIALTLMFALQSLNAYTQFGMLPQILTDAGISPARAGVLVAVVAGWGLVGGLVMPTVIARAPGLPWIVGGFGLLTASGYLGLLLAPSVSPLLWSCVLGIGGFAFPTAIALLPA